MPPISTQEPPISAQQPPITAQEPASTTLQEPASTTVLEPASPTARRPLFRREPWLALLLLAFVLMATVMLLPEEVRRFGTYLGLGIGAIGVIFLIIHKPDPADEARWREYRRHDY
jgi:hypothetical protein